MTNNQLKQHVKDLTTQIQDMERQLPDGCHEFDTEFAKAYVPLYQELQTAILLLDSRRNPVQAWIDAFYCLSASWPLLLSGYSLGFSLALVGLNFLALYLLLRKTRGLLQSIHRRSFFLWLLSDLGGTLPEWYAYCASVRRQLGFHAVLFIIWLIPYFLLLPFSGAGMLFGMALMFMTFVLEHRMSHLDLALNAYPIAKGVAELKTIEERIDDGRVDLCFTKKRG